MMDDIRTYLNRRTFLRRGAAGLGSIALASLLDPALFTQPAAAANLQPPTSQGGGGRAKRDGGGRGQDHWAGVVHPLPYPQKIQRVIQLYMAGGPSHLETFDFKPKLAEMNGKPMPESFTKGQQIAQLQGQKLHCFGPQHPFKRYGKSG